MSSSTWTITRAEQFRFFANSLKSDRLRQYVGMMVKEAEDYFAKWGDEGEVDLLDALSELIVLTASRCLLGREIRETLFSEVTTLVHDLDKGMVPLSVFFPYAPIEAHRKRDKARKELAAIFDKVIQGRRESGAVEPDVLQTFIDARYKDGSRLSNDQVLGMLIAVLFAGQHTSSITSTWTGLLSIANKERIFPNLEKEQKDVMAKHGDKIDFDILAEMDELHFCIKEALRMHPPPHHAPQAMPRPLRGGDHEGQEVRRPQGAHRRHVPGVCAPHGRGVLRAQRVQARAIQGRIARGQEGLRVVHRVRKRQARMHGRDVRVHADQDHLVAPAPKL